MKFLPFQKMQFAAMLKVRGMPFSEQKNCLPDRLTNVHWVRACIGLLRFNGENYSCKILIQTLMFRCGCSEAVSGRTPGH